MSISAFGVSHPEPVSKSAQGFGGRAASRFMFGPEKAWAKEGMLRPKVYMTNKKLQAANQLDLVADAKGSKTLPRAGRSPEQWISGSPKIGQVRRAGEQARKNARARGE